MKLINNPERNEWASILKRPTISSQSIERIVNEVFEAIQKDGDAALKRYTAQFDKVELETLEVSQKEVNASSALLSEGLKSAIQLAKSNIEKFHASQKIEKKVITTSKGVECC